MKFNKKLKFALPALLLAASVSVYADEEAAVVSLNNNAGTVTWSQFVGVLNGNIKVVGDTTKLPEDDRLALGTAINAVNNAEKNLADIKAEGSSYQKAISEASGNLEEAKSTQSEEAKKVSAAKTAYDDAQSSLTTEQDNLTNLENDRKKYESLISGVNSQKQEYTEHITNLTAELTPLVAQTITKEIKTIKPWLKSAIDNEASFAGNYSTYYKGAKAYKSYTVNQLAAAKLYPNSYIYCNIIYEEDREEYYLELSFTELPNGVTCVDLFNVDSNTTFPQNLSNDTWYKLSVALLDYYILEPQYYSTNTTPILYTMESVDVYLGPEYPNAAGYFNVPWTPASKLASIFSSITSPLDALSSKEEYVTTTYEQSNPNQARIDEINEEISDWKSKTADANKVLAGYNKILNGVHGDAVTEDNPETDGILDNIEKTNATINTLKQTTIPSLKKAWDDAVEALKPYDDAVNSAQNALTQANKALTDAEAAAQAQIDNATAALATARQTAQTAANTMARNNYNTVELEGDVTVTTPIASFSGTIFGKDHIVTVPTGSYMFNTFTGSLSELAINGNTFRSTNSNASFTNVARWNGTSGILYGESATPTNFTSLGELGFEARNKFGVDFAANQLATKGTNTIVYKVTVKEVGAADVAQFVTVNTDNEFVSAKNTTGFTLPDNVFALSQTTDLKGIANVYYPDNTCDNVVIKDRVNFYAPATIQAANVELVRNFTAGSNSVCLPFAVKASDFPANTYVCTYDREEENRFWFTKVAGDIPANMPMLIYASKAGQVNFSNITIKQTPEDQFVKDEGSESEAGCAYGTFKGVMAREFRGEFEKQQYYGLTKSGNFEYAGNEDQVFPAFRTVIYSAIAKTQTEEAKAAPRRVAIRDERGVDITDIVTGVANATAASSDLEIAGGNGMIRITSEADYGMVDIYSIDGKLVTVANVTEGTTTVEVQHGIYIVMGKKVMVK